MFDHQKDPYPSLPEAAFKQRALELRADATYRAERDALDARTQQHTQASAWALTALCVALLYGIKAGWI